MSPTSQLFSVKAKYFWNKVTMKGWKCADGPFSSIPTPQNGTIYQLSSATYNQRRKKVFDATKPCLTIFQEPLKLVVCCRKEAQRTLMCYIIKRLKPLPLKASTLLSNKRCANIYSNISKLDFSNWILELFVISSLTINQVLVLLYWLSLSLGAINVRCKQLFQKNWFCPHLVS